MTLFLRTFFVVILGSMLAITTWASLHTPLFEIPRDVLRHPWFIATLADAYWAFLSVYVWIAWKEQSNTARVLWLIAIVGLGNITISVYALRELARVGPGEALSVAITRRNPGHLTFPAVLTALTVIVYLLA